MAVSKQKKVEILASLTEQIKNAKSVWFASSVWVTVKEFGDLRKKLREVDASYTLAKKTLIKKAVKDALDIDIDLAVLEWQIAIICSNDDPIAGLSKVNEFLKENFKTKKKLKLLRLCLQERLFFQDWLVLWNHLFQNLQDSLMLLLKILILMEKLKFEN